MKMKNPLLFSTAVVLQYVLVQCSIPGLIVKRMDKTLIARKRQDTMDMCRIFTEESEKSRHIHAPKIIKSYRPVKEMNRYKRDVAVDDEKVEKLRSKREVTMKYAVNPALNAEDAKRVENIVDKLYDELEEKGEKVTYRQVETTSPVKVNRNQTLSPSRRFDFAPAFLLGPHSQLKKKIQPEEPPYPSKARWKHGIIPYFIDSKTYDAHLIEVIMKAFDYFEKATCIRLQKLREKPTDKRSMEEVAWLYISNPTGIRQCVHSNEKRVINGVQMTVFGYDCMSLGDIVHEVMHILGFSHEHLRSDRDQYISVLWDNIKPGYKKYFDLNIIGSEYELENLPYDYSSILHYPPRAFSRNGKVTILAEQGVKIGQREGLSEIDVEKVALIYSNECISRNREYLLQTCPSVVKSVTKPSNISQKEIEDYFKDRIWSFGIINYKLRDKLEFTVEERENINAVFRHIEQETCLQFRDAAADEKDADDKDDNDDDQANGKKETHEPIYQSANATEVEKKVDNPEPEVTPPNPDANAEQLLIVGSDLDLPLNESPEHDDDNDTNEQRAHIVITKPKVDDSENVNKKDLRDNEIPKNDNENTNYKRSGKLFKDLKNKNITMKKALLRKAIAKKLKQKARRFRRDTSSTPPGTRRHANSILVLKRTPDPACICPEPGAIGGDKSLDISAGCFNSVNDLLHFFVHVLGLDHQHNMHDRDNYLHIVWENLTQDVQLEMQQKLPPAASVGFPYDYQSVMHYPWLQIKNGKTNIMYPIWNDGWAMGHWQGLSSTDVQKLNLLYFNQCVERQKHEKQ